MKRFKNWLFTTMVLWVMAMGAQAQCTMENTAFKSGEYLSYNLYFNWKFVWVKVGSAALSTVSANYKGQSAYKCSLQTKGNGKLDKFFVMRDTLLSYISQQMVPLYFRKGATEGKHYTLDEVLYDYKGGKCNLRMYRKKDNGQGKWTSDSRSECIVDMLNLFIKARSYDNSGWKPGWKQNVQVADGDGINPGYLEYKGKETIKGDNDVKYRCLKLSYYEYKKSKKKYKELAVFYVTDDANHIPVRIDFNLNFGSAKAYVTGMRGTRSPVTAKAN